MKRSLVTLVAVMALACTAVAQTNTPPPLPEAVDTNVPPVYSPPIDQFLGFLTTGSNWIIAPYGIYDEGSEKWGAGLGFGYKVNDFFIPTMRIDWLDDRFWMPSASIQLQVPVRLFDKVKLTPFVISGIATPVSGAGDDNGTVVGIFGAGMAVGITEKFFVLYDYEKWTTFDGNQHRFGFAFRF